LTKTRTVNLRWSTAVVIRDDLWPIPWFGDRVLIRMDMIDWDWPMMEGVRVRV